MQIYCIAFTIYFTYMFDTLMYISVIFLSRYGSVEFAEILCILLSVVFLMQQAAHHQEVTEDVRSKALLYGVECTTRYIDLLDHVLLVCVCDLVF